MPLAISALDLYKKPRLHLCLFEYFNTMNPRIEFYKATFLKRGNGFDIRVFVGIFRYQYGKGLGDVVHGILKFISKVARFFKPVVMKGAQTVLKSGSEAIKEGATVNDVIKSTLKPTVQAVLGATVDQVACKLIEMRNNKNDAPPTNPPIVLPKLFQAGSGTKRRHRLVYKAPNRSKY